jgi:gluconate 2-dehydrogenase gamma chain
MNRRTYLELMMKAGLLATLPFSALLETHAAIPNNGFADLFLEEKDFQFLATISETIIPQTETIGAIEAGVHHFADLYIKHCFTESRQRNFVESLKKYYEYLNQNSIPIDKTNEALTKQFISDELSTSIETRPFKEFIRQTKIMVVKGYFTNQKAVQQNLYYKAVPGNYQACIDIATIGKAWIN